MEIKTVGVIGAGQMGNGIAQVMAHAGIEVVMQDIAEEFLEKGMAAIRKSMDRLLKKEKITEEEREGTLSRVRTTLDPKEMAAADLVVEAATEREDLKLKIFADLDGICREVAILATNTSSISITRIAAATGRPEKVIGMHFMNPVPMMELVEIIRGLATSDETFEAVMTLCERIGKTPVEASDFPGFIVNRVLMPMINEAVFALYEGVGSPEAIDEAMKLGTNQPMGPLELADLIGLDTCLAIMEVLHGGLGDSKYRPCPLLRKHVDAGFLGRKSRRGFYTYD